MCEFYPMLLLPTHRSYMDFLLTSYVCYQFNLPLPVIAAGLDFLGLQFLSRLLRNSGAFFIRRSFGEDKLYWAVFTEYVQSQLLGGEAPLEFFLEGTRSRTAKSLNPKLGLLQTSLELYFTGQVPDITIVPIAISYDRTLEETLYAYELLGIPKPKESTSGLIKARSLLNDNFGSVYFNIIDPISVKEFCGNAVDRSLHSLEPRHRHVLFKTEVEMCSDLAGHVIRSHQRHMVLSPFPLVCLVLGQHLVEDYNGMMLDSIVLEIRWLSELIEHGGGHIVTEGNVSFNDAVKSSLSQHATLVTLQERGRLEVVRHELDESDFSHPNLRLLTRTIQEAAIHMRLYHYGNQALQLLVHFSMVALAIRSSQRKEVSIEELQNQYDTLRKLIQREFVFQRRRGVMDLQEAVGVMEVMGLLSHNDCNVLVVDSSLRKMDLLSSLLLPFLAGYRQCCLHLLSSSGTQLKTLSEASRHCQVAVEKALVLGHISDYRCLSLDIMNNCLANLVTLGALKKEKRKGQVLVLPIRDQINSVLSEIDFYMPGISKGWHAPVSDADAVYNITSNL
ncbi:dihydroxyacetone phosphate acyltransferase-like isoform X1 [Tachypleus tridentatus]|uniref:dihydroxyacetone phosphate acyltransferase-like isoform X1 n=1 Tax=Tachypleus tridentatus TaxID=6853 RepID=UPI003FD0310D